MCHIKKEISQVSFLWCFVVCFSAALKGLTSAKETKKEDDEEEKKKKKRSIRGRKIEKTKKIEEKAEHGRENTTLL